MGERRLHERDDFRFGQQTFQPFPFCVSICLVVSSPAIVVPLSPLPPPPPAAVYANATPLNLTSRVYARLRFVRHMRIRPRTYISSTGVACN